MEQDTVDRRVRRAFVGEQGEGGGGATTPITPITGSDSSSMRRARLAREVGAALSVEIVFIFAPGVSVYNATAATNAYASAPRRGNSSLVLPLLDIGSGGTHNMTIKGDPTTAILTRTDFVAEGKDVGNLVPLDQAGKLTAQVDSLLAMNRSDSAGMTNFATKITGALTSTIGGVIGGDINPAEAESIVTLILDSLEDSATELVAKGGNFSFASEDGSFSMNAGRTDCRGAYTTVESGNATFRLPSAWSSSCNESPQHSGGEPNGSAGIFSSLAFAESPYVWLNDTVEGSVAGLTLFEGGGGNGPQLITEMDQCIDITLKRGGAGTHDAVATSVPKGQGETLSFNFTRHPKDFDSTLSVVVEAFHASVGAPEAPVELEVFVFAQPLFSNSDRGVDVHASTADHTFRSHAVRAASQYNGQIGDRSHVLQIETPRDSYYACSDPLAQVSTLPANASGPVVYTVIVRGNNTHTVAVAVDIFHAKCEYLEKNGTRWLNDNCSVTPFSTLSTTHCACNHLTSFSASTAFVKPNVVKVRLITADDIHNNPVVFIPIMLLWVLFVWMLKRSYESDKYIKRAGQIITIGDDKVTDKGRYRITIKTGVWPGAGIVRGVPVYIQLQGSLGETGEIELSEDSIALFVRNASDDFVVSTPQDIGGITGVTVRQGGETASDRWYLSFVIVTNLGLAGSSRICWFNKWLSCAPDLHAETYTDGAPESVTSPAQLITDVTSFWQKFSYNLSTGVVEGSKVVSVFLCPPDTKFTHMERAVTFMLFVFGVIFANAFYFDDGSGEARQSQIMTPTPPSFKVAQNLDLRCVSLQHLRCWKVLEGKNMSRIQNKES